MNQSTYLKAEMNNFLGIPVRVSSLDFKRDVPNKKHKKRSNQSAAYHARIQKKWIKRFGTHVENYALIVNNRALGLNGKETLFIDKGTAVMLHNFI